MSAITRNKNQHFITKKDIAIGVLFGLSAAAIVAIGIIAKISSISPETKGLTCFLLGGASILSALVALGLTFYEENKQKNSNHEAAPPAPSQTVPRREIVELLGQNGEVVGRGVRQEFGRITTEARPEERRPTGEHSAAGRDASARCTLEYTDIYQAFAGTTTALDLPPAPNPFIDPARLLQRAPADQPTRAAAATAGEDDDPFYYGD